MDKARSIYSAANPRYTAQTFTHASHNKIT